jgi:hypothetical protein
MKKEDLMRPFTRNLITVLLLFYTSFSAVANNSTATEKAALSKLMQAIAQNDYEAFIADGTIGFKRGITKPAFETVVNQVGKRVEGGYKTEYLAHLNQRGYKVHVWKISYETSKEDTLAKLVMSNNKVAGFWLQ